jgi:hypothetical protein
MKFPILFLFLTIFSLGSVASAQALDLGAPSSAVSTVISSYRSYKDIDSLTIKVPTVVEVFFPNDFIERFNFAVVDKNTNSLEPYFFKQEILSNEIPLSVSSNPDTRSINLLNDKNTRTYADFPLPDNSQGQVQITLTSPTPVTSSALTILLDNNVALPSSVDIRAVVAGQERAVVAKSKLDQSTIRFPETSSDRWTITFTFGQPLRISELNLIQNNTVKSRVRSVRFLAQKDHSYRIYFDPDRVVATALKEAGNLASAKDVSEVLNSPSKSNPAYVVADIDGDNIPDVRDNCIYIPNTDQEDVNNNGRGDECDDFDQDGLINAKDNCPDNPNSNQKDSDSDGVGDVCDKEESRITERYPWLPWVGIGFAALVLIILLVLTVKSNPQELS